MATLHLGSEGYGTDGTNGRVGIATTTPAAPLHIAGSTNVVRLDHVGILDNPHLWITQNAYYDGTWHRITDGNKAGGLDINDSTGDLSILMDPNSTGTPALATTAIFKNNGDLKINGNIQVDDGTGYPGLKRVATTQKVYNVLDYGAVQLQTRVASIIGQITASNTLTDSNINTSNVTNGDILWVQNNANLGMYTVTNVYSGYLTISGSFRGYSSGTISNVSWKVTSAGTSGDNTFAFNQALSAAGTEGGGVVYVPTGYYIFNNSTTTIFIPTNVILRGMWSASPTWISNRWQAGIPQGPVLLCLSNQGTAGDASHPSFITLSGGVNQSPYGAMGGSCSVEGLTIYYPIQYLQGTSGSTSFTVQLYPYCIEFQSNSSISQANGYVCDCRAMNLLLVNPYQGIKMEAQAGQGGGGVGRNHVCNIYGCPLSIGISINNLSDVSYIEKVHFQPDFFYLYDYTYDATPNLRNDWNTFFVQNLTAIKIAHAVFLVLKDIFAIFAHNGIWITDDATTGSVQGLFGTNIQFDMADCGIYVSQSGAHVANAEFVNVRITCGNVGNVNQASTVYARNHCIYGDPNSNASSQCSLMLTNGTLMSWIGGNTIDWEIQFFLRVTSFLFIDNTTAVANGVYVTKGRAQIYGCLFQHNSGGFTQCISITSGADVGIVYGNDYRESQGNAPGTNSAVRTAFAINGAATLYPTSAPPSPAQNAEGRVYIRNNKLIIQFNDAGTVRYKYLNLTGTGVTWTHTTTPP